MERSWAGEFFLVDEKSLLGRRSINLEIKKTYVKSCKYTRQAVPRINWKASIQEKNGDPRGK